MEFDAGHLYSNVLSASSSISSFSTLFSVEFEVLLAIIFVRVLTNHFAPIVATIVSQTMDGFSHLFFIGAIHFFTSFFVRV
jgi:hypothetical protein